MNRVVRQAAPPLVGLTSLAAGADQHFAECILAARGVLHVIVPCKGYEQTFLQQEARERYLWLLNKAESVEQLSYSEPSEEAFLEAGRRIVAHSDLIVAIWDGQKSRGKGGTADIVEYARSLGVPVAVVWPAGVRRPHDR